MTTVPISFTQSVSQLFEIDLVDDDGEHLDLSTLIDAVAEFHLRVNAGDLVDVIHFVSPSASLSFKSNESALLVNFEPIDTAAVALGLYVYRVKLTYADGSIKYPIEWSPFYLSLGGVTEPAQPVFDETTVLNHNYGLDDALRYMTPGGSPIANAHVRVYYQTDYAAGNLETPIGTTTTKTDGRWVNTLMVRPGYTYVVQFQKPNEFGPDTATIVA